MSKRYIIDKLNTPAGDIPKVATRLAFQDKLGTIKTRANIGRMNYVVEPGLYAVGNPGHESPVFVSANFKLSFDHLRKNLDGVNGWILVLDTKGINVWCAAGKGTFGTDEIVRQINECRLGEIVGHRKLVVPQLGAPGVAAHAVKEQTGFRVLYGPVRAEDLQEFMRSGFKTTEPMRRIKFDLFDRVVLIPVELTLALKWFFLVSAVLIIIAAFSGSEFSPDRALSEAGPAIIALFIGVICGAVVVPALLPWIPFSPFSVKGIIAGAIGAAFAFQCIPIGFMTNVFDKASWIFAIIGISSFLAMNFTGASTYTCLSGVLKEMKYSIPVQALFVLTGAVLWIIGRFQ